MKMLKKEVTRREFLKCAAGSALLLGLAGCGIKTKNKEKINNSYGTMAYGGKNNG